ncbi:polyadenylation factor subunit 2 [Ceratobasidium sp. AG-Ba]|nr:polyadenylation factor subunit 2 [Ceratobasidium sp. AG-Ba]
MSATTSASDRLATSRPTAPSTWRAQRHISPLPRPPVDPDIDAPPKMGPDGRIIKKVRPRRTVDLWAGVGRWEMASIKKVKPVGSRVPVLKPAASYIIDMLPPKAYPDNAATSITTKFVHTSTNKVRCPVNCVVWTPEGRRILTGSTSGEFTLWNGLTFNFETILQAHETAIRALTFSHSGAYLISADQSGVIKYYQPNMNNLVTWQAHREAVRGVSFAPGDSRFASCGDDASVRVWAFEEMREERCITGESYFGRYHRCVTETTLGHGWDVKCIEWHPTRGLLVSGSKDNLVKFWDPRTGQNLSTLHQHKNTIQAIKWNPNGNLVATASRDQTVRVFDIRAMKELHILKGHKKEVCSLTWHPVHHDLLVSGGAEGSVYFWTLSAATPSAPRAAMDQAHESNVWALAYHPLGHILCTGSNDHTTRFWCRDRPGEGLSGTGTGGMEESTEEDGGYDALPGFGYSGAGAAVGSQGGDGGGMDWETAAGGMRAPTAGWGSAQGDEFIPGFGRTTLPQQPVNDGAGSGRAPPPLGLVWKMHMMVEEVVGEVDSTAAAATVKIGIEIMVISAGDEEVVMGGEEAEEVVVGNDKLHTYAIIPHFILAWGCGCKTKIRGGICCPTDRRYFCGRSTNDPTHAGITTPSFDTKPAYRSMNSTLVEGILEKVNTIWKICPNVEVHQHRHRRLHICARDMFDAVQDMEGEPGLELAIPDIDSTLGHVVQNIKAWSFADPHQALGDQEEILARVDVELRIMDECGRLHVLGLEKQWELAYAKAKARDEAEPEDKLLKIAEIADLEPESTSKAGYPIPNN